MFVNHRFAMDKFSEPPLIDGDSLIVIASGPSGAGPWPTHPGVPVIAVNGAVEGLPWPPDYWFTLDPSPDNMGRLASLSEKTQPIIAADPDLGPEAHNPKYRQDFGRATMLCLKRESEDTGDRKVLVYGNSGRAAIHLAMHMGAKRIAVFGVDGTTDPYWFDKTKRPGTLKTLGRGCGLLKKDGVKLVFADTGVSTVQNQVKAAPDKVLAWIQAS